MNDPDALMAFASELLVGAGALARERFGCVATEYKADGSEVTAADREIEALLRAELRERFPEDGILGEEDTEVASSSGRRWLLDPIDGTRSFASGVPLYGMLLALEVDGVPRLGCCHLPELGDTLVAARGAGAWLNGGRARVSECAELGEARLLTSGWEYWRDRADPEMRDGWDRLADATRFARTWGDCFGYCLVATGRAELLCDPISGARWDYGPMLPILEEAGGRFTTFSGNAVCDWSSALASNGALHASASALLAG
ncbi:histidinol-phosphatase [soil metagenome]